MRVESGSYVGPYRVLTAVGAGGMGEVYRARDEKLNRDIALKVLSADLASSSEHLRRFEQEARAASALNHPNIIAIYDIGRASDGVAYIAMELVDGEDLRNLSGASLLPLKHMLRVAVKVADGLAAAHERGIVHRDLKPENVMISRDGFVKILDFGLAKLARPVEDSESTLPHTTPGAVFGTVGYMSPEQASGRPADFPSDQFALGVIMYEMLTGRLPFSEPTAAETLAAIIRKEPAPVDKPSIPPELLRIVYRCLEKDPAERYAATRDLARDLREVRDRVTHPSEPMYRSDRPPILPRRRAGLWTAAAAGAVMLVAGSVVVYQRHAGAAEANGRRHAVAVAPFTDASGTSEGQNLADGIAHAISGRISSSGKIRGVDPLENGVAMTTDDPREYGRRVGAELVVRGSVQRENDNMHITYSVLDTGSGEQLAGETVTGQASELFKLEDQVADGILRALDLDVLQQRDPAVAADLASAADQAAYTEAVGILRRSKDEPSVDRAIRLLERVLVDARDSARVNALLGQALLNKSQLGHRPALTAQASIYAERAVELDPTLPDGHVTLGKIRNAAGKPKEAAAEFQRALDLRPDSKEAVLGLADSMSDMGRGADAERLYQKVISLQPEWAAPYNKYGLFCLKRGRCAEAVTNLKKFVQLLPNSPRTQTNLGAAYQCLGDYDAALRAYQKSVEIGPTAAAYSNVGFILFLLGRYGEAVQANERAVALAPSDYLIWANLGDTYRWTPGMREKSTEAYDHALVAARQALVINARDALTHAVMGACLAKRGDLEAASVEVTAALKLDPTDPNVLYDAALVNHIRGNSDAALSWLQRAVESGYPVTDLKRDPEFAGLRTHAAFQALKNPRKQDA